MYTTLNPLYVHLIEGKAVLVYAMKAYSGSRVIAPFIRNLGSSWRSVVSFKLRSL